MKKQFLTIAMLTALLLTSCQQKAKEESLGTKIDTATAAVATAAATATKAANDIVTDTLTDASGKKLILAFNNTKDNVTLTFNNETAELAGQKPASGIWYKNDHYDLSGKEDHVKLTKDGKTVFEN